MLPINSCNTDTSVFHEVYVCLLRWQLKTKVSAFITEFNYQDM